VTGSDRTGRLDRHSQIQEALRPRGVLDTIEGPQDKLVQSTRRRSVGFDANARKVVEEDKVDL